MGAVVAIAGPMDLAATCTDHQSAKTPEAVLLGAPVGCALEEAALASPLIHAVAARAPAPPHLLIHGEEDGEVPIEQSVALADALSASGTPVTLLRIPGGGHPIFGFVRCGAESSLDSARSRWDAALNVSIVEFLDRSL